jgi:hypothetical protein
MMTDYWRPEFEKRLDEICGLYVDLNAQAGSAGPS